jgi:tRNA pseudouridine38-40 synthase
MRIMRLDLVYDGTSFHGWARQRANVRTVEGVLTEALELVLRERPSLSAAGRTDSGVHARGQVVSFPAGPSVDPPRVVRSVNRRLSPEVVVTGARWAPDGFDARFSATAREYAYRLNVGEAADPFEARFEWHRPGALSVPAMRRAARDLLGEHDFASFCRTPQGDRSTVRTLTRLSVRRAGERVVITARADGFLHQMVRSLVETLVAVGAGRMSPGAMPGVLAAGDRAATGHLAPPHGLTLERVFYGRRSAAPSDRGR